MEDLTLGRIAALVSEFALKDLPLDRTLMMMMIHVSVSRTGKCDELGHSNVERYFHSMGKVQKSGVWVPHALSQNHKNQRGEISASLLAHHRLAREQHRPLEKKGKERKG